ncbi:PDZ domain-containing protein [Candidatus Sulfurimonas baltica]|uniref:PDZ domain-containing protein n=1 Tax=Candidatus Sulfurimonas baltica TaxID=2740404 RepID=A0A7S7RNS3_9BACT|nr:PDZ domain-containing protein [Candidatus Sulfurimonas baltica]QOY52844.1 PDZ domain-containing protein [Candidatus Sulfurimonas baltica]
MKKIYNSTIISILTKVLILLVVAKALSLVVLWYLPSEGVELNVKENYQPKYQRVDFKNMIQQVKKEIINKPVNSVESVGTNITDMILSGLYGTKSSGFIIIALKAKPKNTEIIAVGEKYNGYILKSIAPMSAILQKNGKEYVLYLEKQESKTTSHITKVQTDDVFDSKREVTREDIATYAKNPKEMWKDISIVEVKDGKNIKGFKVTKINEKSKFAKLGLKVSDVIIKANNVKLNSYKDALDIYKNIDKLDTIQIVVIRNNQEMELVYEIN